MELKTATYAAIVENVEYLGADPLDEYAVLRIHIRPSKQSGSDSWVVSPSFLASPQAIAALRHALNEYDARTKDEALPMQ